jgi:hypothetical protein
MFQNTNEFDGRGLEILSNVRWTIGKGEDHYKEFIWGGNRKEKKGETTERRNDVSVGVRRRAW